MLVAVSDQSVGTSTLRCSKISLPFQSWMMASRSSHVTSSKGETPGRGKCRSNWRPGAVAVAEKVCAELELEAAEEGVATGTVDSAMGNSPGKTSVWGA